MGVFDFFRKKKENRVEEEINDILEVKEIDEFDVVENENNNEAQEKDTAVSLSDTGCWDDFMEYLQSDDSKTDKTERLVCKLDRDLADSLDDCDIHGRCRSDLVNAIVRAFFKSYLPRLAEYRREKKSLFNSYNL